MSAAEQVEDRRWIVELTEEELMLLPVGQARTYYTNSGNPVSVMHWEPACFKQWGGVFPDTVRAESYSAAVLVQSLRLFNVAGRR